MIQNISQTTCKVFIFSQKNIIPIATIQSTEAMAYEALKVERSKPCFSHVIMRYPESQKVIPPRKIPKMDFLSNTVFCILPLFKKYNTSHIIKTIHQISASHRNLSVDISLRDVLYNAIIRPFKKTNIKNRESFIKTNYIYIFYCTHF